MSHTSAAGAAWLRAVDICNHRQCAGVLSLLAGSPAHQRGQALDRVNGGAVGFVERSLEHKRDLELGAHRFVVACHVQSKLPRLEHIDAADEDEWCIVGKTNGAEVNAAGSHKNLGMRSIVVLCVTA